MVHIKKISAAITAGLVADKIILASEDAVFGRVFALISANMEAERLIDEEAHKLLDKNRRMVGGDIDEQKAFAMIKKQLAKQRNFVL